MASPVLKEYEYGRKSNDIVGTVILADATTQVYAVSDGTSQVVLGAFDATGLVDYGYQTNYPLMLKLFCYDVVVDSTGEFKVMVSGKLGDTTCVRRDDDLFGMTWGVRNWDSLTDADVTVSIRPYPPMMSVSMNCVCGLSTDYIDREGEGSYA